MFARWISILYPSLLPLSPLFPKKLYLHWQLRRLCILLAMRRLLLSSTVSVNKETGPVTRIMTERATPYRLLCQYKYWWGITMVKISFPFYKTSCDLSSRDPTLPYHRAYRWYVEKLLNEQMNSSIFLFFSLSLSLQTDERINSAVLIFDGIRVLSFLLKRHSVCLYQEVDAWLEETPRPSMDRKIDIPTVKWTF